MKIKKDFQNVLILTTIITICLQYKTVAVRHYTKKDILRMREEVRAMFQHAYEGYLRYASDYDELRPLTCDGVDTWGSYSLTLIDALDTLATMGNFSEFRRVAQLLETKMNFDKDINVSVFETNIRIVGGLLSAHLLSKRAGLPLESGWPCQGPLLRLAEDVARRLLPAFDTATGMPYGTVNLRYGVPKGETAVTCTAGVGTFMVEFGTLSRLTGNPIYEDVALNAVYALWERRSPIGLFGNHIDVQTGRWTALDAGIGAGVDSLFEYLVKGAILLNRPELLQMFHEARHAIDKYLKRDDWYIWVGMNKGQVTLPVFQSLEAFWPGTLSLIGDIGPAMRTLTKYSSVWRKYGFLPEFYNIPLGEASVNRESYPLRPELVESLMYLYRATKNQFLLEIGEDMLNSIEFSAKTKCGYATIRNVVTHEKENRMESFFLAETTKYLYLLFDEDNFLHNDGATGESLETPHGECVIQAGAYIFNTEAHPVDMSALYCCHDIKEDIYEGLDLALYSDNALLKVERESRIAAELQNPKYQCGDVYNSNEQTTTVHKTVAATESEAKQKQAENSLTVDIEVFDEDNNPAAEVLIENFERIKSEIRVTQADQLQRNQLTVNDLDEFFAIERKQFKNTTEALQYVVAFMRNYTLDAAFISGLQIFDKNVTGVLGAGAQKEFESRMRSIWELYELEQEYAVNARLALQLGIVKYDDDNNELLDDILTVLNHNNVTSLAVHKLRVILTKISNSRLAYEQALVNTTAMQEFLLKILINGTMEKKRSYKALLNESEISMLTTQAMNETAQRKLFDKLRKVVEFKKRMIETFEKLQTLMHESNKQVTETTSATTTTTETVPSKVPNDDLIVATEQLSIPGEQQKQLNKPTTNTSPTTTNVKTNESKNINDLQQQSRHTISDEPDDSSDSMWSQLVHTILRKTTIRRTKFDEQLLHQKTRSSLQKYAQQKINYELFTCQRPKFIEKFAYRDFYP